MTVPAWIQPIIQEMLEFGMATNATICGCTPEEVTKIETVLNIKLPRSYVEFLLTMGKKPGEFLSDCLIAYPEILEYGQEEGRLKLEGTNFSLSPTMFVFVERDNLFFYFDTLEGPDPACYRFLEGDEYPEKIAESFTSWLAFEVHAEILNIKEARMESK